MASKMGTKEMTEGPLLPGIIRYVIPVIATGVLQLLFNAADLIVVGRFCGSESVAAVGATTSLTVLLVNFFMGLSVGGGVLTAQGLGAGDSQKVHRTVHTSIPVALILGGVVTFLGFFGSEPLLRLMDTPESVLPLSALYMRIYFCGQIFNLLYNYGASILRAAGDTKSPLIFLTAAGILNFSLNVVFVTAFHMDVAGVALATALSQVLSAVLVLRALMKREDACRFDFRKMRIYKAPFKEMLRIGVPAGINGLTFSLANVLCQSSVNSFGEAAVAGNAAASSIGGFVYTSMNAFHHTAVNFTGQNHGAGRYDRIRKVMWYCFGLSLVLGTLLGGLANLFGRPLLEIYITDSAAAVEMGLIRLRMVCLLYALCGMQEVTVGILRGMGYSMAPTAASLTSVIGFRILWIFTAFRAYRSLWVLYLSFPLSWIGVLLINSVIIAVAFHRRKANG